MPPSLGMDELYTKKRNRRLRDIFLCRGSSRQHKISHRYHFSKTPMTQLLLPSLGFRGLVARPSGAADFGGRRALLEPFDMAQGRLREFARRRSRLHGAGHPKGHATATMVLGPFAETKVARSPGRNPAIPITTWSLKLVQHVPHVPTVVEGKNQDGFPITTVGNDRRGREILD
jgi:hypothetical protein